MTLQLVEKDLENREREIVSEEKFPGFIGESNEMKKIFSFIERVADSNSTVMIYGESGTGKEMVAKAIHQSSCRKHKPFIAINCGAIPENILESELFGHVKGAFTGAINPKAGKFELANGGTILLDEIGDMSPDLQVKVLRVLEERSFERVGGSKTINVDIRVIAATHRDLEEEVRKGNFREDLFYRLEVIPITLPPLRKRKSDIPYLVEYFLESLNEKVKRNVKRISDEALEIMEGYSWPGNVRELRNIMERIIVLTDGDVISSKDIPSKLKEKEFNPEDSIDIGMTNKELRLNNGENNLDKSHNVRQIEKGSWIKCKVAKLLQLNRTNHVEKIVGHHFEECTSH
jgi:transcriptional regulator with PAS, ATPase and Fis domain